MSETDKDSKNPSIPQPGIANTSPVQPQHQASVFKKRPQPRGYKWSAKVPRTQADRVLAKFGGPRRLSKLLKALAERNPTDPQIQTLVPSSIYRWRYPVEKGGTGGIVPTRAIPLLIQAARMDGIFLDEEDLYPGVIERRDWELDDRLDAPVKQNRRKKSP
jgi:hypothetical protein